MMSFCVHKNTEVIYFEKNKRNVPEALGASSTGTTDVACSGKLVSRGTEGGWPPAGGGGVDSGGELTVGVVGPGTVAATLAAAAAATATVDPTGELEGGGLATGTGMGAVAELGVGTGMGVGIAGTAAGVVAGMAVSAVLGAVGTDSGAGTEIGTTGVGTGTGIVAGGEVFCVVEMGSVGSVVRGATCGGATPAFGACWTATSCFTGGLPPETCVCSAGPGFTAAVGVGGLLLAPAANGDNGLLRALGAAPGLEHIGGEDKGCWKGEVTLGEEVGRGDACATGLDFKPAASGGLSCFGVPGLGCWGGGCTVTGDA